MAGSGANTVRLTKLNPLLGSGVKPPSGSSLLKPSYLTGGSSNSATQPPMLSLPPPQQQQQQQQYQYQPPQPAAAASCTSMVPLNHSFRASGVAGNTGSVLDWASSGAAGLAAGGGAGAIGSYNRIRPPPPPHVTETALVPINDDISLKRRNGSDGDTDADSSIISASGKKKRRSRWAADDAEKTFIPGMPTVLPANLDKTHEQAYLVQLQIEDFTRRLRSTDLGISADPDKRSPSPEPIYGSDGKRLNTRDYRTRKRLEEDRHKLIVQMFHLNPEYRPPFDYKPPANKIQDKIFIPQDEHPEINFIGLLIGPRGNTLKALEKESGAKIIIRGKGSVKEGKVGRKDGLPMPGEDEPLHALVTSSNPDCVKRANERIKQIIREGVEVPEEQNDLRKNQLRELALLNGTLRDTSTVTCQNCGATSHKSWQCPDKPNITNHVICTLCGGAGHVARDCRQGVAAGGGGVGGGMSGVGGGGGPGERAKIDHEYMSLMAELGEGPAPPPKSSADNNNTTAYGNNMSKYSGNTSFSGMNNGAPMALMAPPPMSGGVGGGGGWAAPVRGPFNAGHPPSHRPPPPHHHQQQQQQRFPPFRPPHQYQPQPPRGPGGHWNMPPNQQQQQQHARMPPPLDNAAKHNNNNWQQQQQQHWPSQHHQQHQQHQPARPPGPVPPPSRGLNAGQRPPFSPGGPPGPPRGMRPPLQAAGPPRPAGGSSYPPLLPHGHYPPPPQHQQQQGQGYRAGAPQQQPQQHQQRNNDLNILAQSGLSNLLAAPPPPPPS